MKHNKITRIYLKKLYADKYAQAGDTNEDFCEWAISFLLQRVRIYEKFAKELEKIK